MSGYAIGHRPRRRRAGTFPVIVHLTPVDVELDMLTCPALERQLMDTAPDAAIMLDMSATVFADCRAVGVLVASRERQRDAGGSLQLIGVSPFVRRVLSLCHLGDLCAPVPRPENRASAS